MLAPHAVDLAVTIVSLIASLYFTFAELFLRQVKLCIGQRKYNPRTEGPKDLSTDQASEFALTH